MRNFSDCHTIITIQRNPDHIITKLLRVLLRHNNILPDQFHQNRPNN